MFNDDCMSPEEYVGALADVGLEGPQRHHGAARLLGVDESTSRRWETGTRAVDPSACHLLLLCIACGLSHAQAVKKIAKINAVPVRSRSVRRAAQRRAVPNRSGSARPESRSVAR